ncbi:MAG: Lrp/AsnC family transcriptional regulator [Candidatus Micrarchaeia archaeon]
MDKIKLELKDHKILWQLELDAMQSYSSIAKKVGLSKEVVKYRIDRMIKSGLIEQFVFMLNTAMLGYTAYKCYLQLENVDEKKHNEIANYLTSLYYSVWVVTCDGNWDMVTALFAKNAAHLKKMLHDLCFKYPENIREISVSTMIDVQHFKRKYLSDSYGEATAVPYYGGGAERIKLDKEEILLLQSLCIDPRKSTIKIAKETGLTVDIIRYRLKKLKEAGFIQGSRLGLNKKLLGLEYHKILLHLKTMPLEREKKLVSFLCSHTNVVDVVRCLGEWDMEIDIDIKTSFELHELIMALKNNFADIIKRYETIQIFKEHKYNFFPMAQKLLEK